MHKYIITSAAVAVVLTAGIAFAQVVGESTPVMVTTTPVTSAPAAGTSGFTVGTIQLTGTGTGSYSVSSIPLTLTTNAGGVASNLSSCQIFNGNGTALNTNGNIPTIQSGSNTFTFDTPLSITNSGTTLTVRCNVSSSTVGGSTFQFIAGPVTLTPGSTPTGTLTASLQTVPSVTSGTQNAILGIIQLSAAQSTQNVNLSSIPLSMSFNGVTPSDFTNCSLQNATNVGTSLNTGNNATATLGSSGTTFALDAPLSITTGGTANLVLICNVSSATPAGGSVTLTLSPGAILATTASSGTSLTPTTGTLPGGGTAPTFGIVEITAPGTTTATPGAPNTGAGGNAPQNLILLASAAAIAIAGCAFLIVRKRTI